jgi:hypothetical protein
LLAALLTSLPREVLCRLRLLIRPDTVLCWHRDFHATSSCPYLPAEAAWPPTHRPLYSRPHPALGAREPRHSAVDMGPKTSMLWCRWKVGSSAARAQRSDQRVPPSGLADPTKRQFRPRARVFEALEAPLRADLDPITEPARIIDLNIRRHDRLGGILHEHSHAA